MKAIAWHACEDGFQCGTLTVPLDPAAPAGPTIDLAVIRKRARDPRRRIGSLVFNPGGPGAPGVSFLTGIASTMPAALRDRFDLVSFDPRASATAARSGARTRSIGSSTSRSSPRPSGALRTSSTG